MTEEKPDLDKLLARLSEHRRSPGELAGHLSAEKLSAYNADELPSEENDAIQEHLSKCSLCTGMLLDLQSFHKPPAEDLPQEGVVDFAAEAEWRSLREKLWNTENALEPPKLHWAASLKTAYSVAAVLGLAVVGLSVAILKLSGELKDPRPGFHITLTSTMGTLGSVKSVEKELSLHEAPAGFSLTLDKDPNLDFPKYVAEIFREKGPRVQLARGLRYQEGEGITLLLSKDDFEPGMYEIILRGLSDGQWRIAGKYRLSVLP